MVKEVTRRRHQSRPPQVSSYSPCYVACTDLRSTSTHPHLAGLQQVLRDRFCFKVKVSLGNGRILRLDGLCLRLHEVVIVSAFHTVTVMLLFISKSGCIPPLSTAQNQGGPVAFKEIRAGLFLAEHQNLLCELPVSKPRILSSHLMQEPGL